VPSGIGKELKFEIRSVNPYQGIPNLSSRVYLRDHLVECEKSREHAKRGKSRNQN